MKVKERAGAVHWSWPAGIYRIR